MVAWAGDWAMLVEDTEIRPFSDGAVLNSTVYQSASNSVQTAKKREVHEFHLWNSERTWKLFKEFIRTLES